MSPYTLLSPSAWIIDDMAPRPLNGLSLCSGIGGLDLGLRAAVGPSYRTVCYVEREAFCAAVLAQRMEDGRLDPAPIWTDLKTFDARRWRGVVDIITAGYPCQPFSAAGKRKGHDDPRHLWPHIAGHIETIKPSYVFCENVPGHLAVGFEQVCHDLQGMGYRVEAGLYSAAEVGAQHLRERLYFLAYSSSVHLRLERGGSGRENKQGEVQLSGHGGEGAMAHAHGMRQLQSQGVVTESGRRSSDSSRQARTWPAEPNVGRMAHGVPHRVDRLRALGNAVVPFTAALAWENLNARRLQADPPVLFSTHGLGDATGVLRHAQRSL